MLIIQLLFILLLLPDSSNSRRRQSQANKAFEEVDGVDWGAVGSESKTSTQFREGTEKPKSSVSSSALPASTTTSTTTEEPATKDDAVEKLLEGADLLRNLTLQVEKEWEEDSDAAENKTIFWIDKSYKAADFNLTIDDIPECKTWQKYWKDMERQTEDLNSTSSEEEEDSVDGELRDSEVITSEKRMKTVGLNPKLLDVFKGIGIVYKEVCGNHERSLWYRTASAAKAIGINENSHICEPFKEALNPDEETLAKLAKKINEIIYNVTVGIQPSKTNTTLDEIHTVNATDTEDLIKEVVGKSYESEPENLEKTSSFEDSYDYLVDPPKPVTTTTQEAIRETTEEDFNDIKVYDDDVYDYRDMARRFKVQHRKVQDYEYDPNEIIDKKRRRRRHVVLKTKRKRRRKRQIEEEDDLIDYFGDEEVEEDSDEDWINVKQVIKTEDGKTTVAIIEETEHGKRSEKVIDDSEDHSWVEIDASDAINPTMLIKSPEALAALGLNVSEVAFERFESVGFHLPGICAEYVPKAIDEFNSSSFEGIEIEGPIGVNITALELAGVNLTALAEKLRNDTEVDDILSRTNGSSKNLGGSFILPVLNKNQYDPFSAPIVFQGSAVVVRFGIYIESMSNFQTSTMDYDMDIYLMMSWRDARLVNPYDKPILVKEEDILEKIWRPDPFFANAKEAEFHEVTFLNFLMRIFPDGLVLYETRVKIKPSCNLILCKYPHDKQTCDLLIKSFAYPIETVRFEWFTKRKDAIDKNPDVKLPELYIHKYETTTCSHARKSGDFSCLRAVFRLKRDVGFHIAQTYIPTSLALMFSWVGVWLPEEFMEGRIGVAITVLLTLSTESAGAREHLPSVSYLKAIDLWFGFITGFVFFTLLQTLFVIGFDKRANQLKKWAGRKRADITEEMREELRQKATRYHKAGRVFYPLLFVLFLIMYYFVFTEGRQDDCMSRRS